MAIGIEEFWKLAVRSGVVAPDRARQLHAQFQAENPTATQGGGAEAGDGSMSLAQWLIRTQVMTNYQAKVLLKGVPGPFRFGEYLVADRFADARFKQSFRAEHSETGHPIVMRFYEQDRIADASAWPVLAQNVATLSQLRSPRMQRYFQWREISDYRFAVVEAFDGETADARLKRDSSLPPEEACRVVRQLAEAIQAFQKTGRPHGDICLENIWLGNNGCVQLLVEPLDWMLPLSLVPNSELDMRRLDYLAPELTVAGKSPDLWTDLYALGCTFYGLLSGKPPFDDSEGADKIRRHVQQPVSPLEPLGVAKEIEQLVYRLMAKNPQVRFQSPQEVIESLNLIVPISDPLPIPSPTLSKYETWLAAPKIAPILLPSQPSPDQPPAAVETIETTGTTGTTPPAIKPPQVKPTEGSDSEQAAFEPLISVSSSQPGAGKPPPKGVVIADGISSAQRRSGRRKKAKSLVVVVWVLVAISFVAAIAILYPNLTRQGTQANTKKKGTDEAKKLKSPSDGKKGSKKNEEKVVTTPRHGSDDGKSLWVNPAPGKPLLLDYLPPGCQLFLMLRPGELEKAEARSSVWRALGPRAEYYREQLEQLTRLKWNEIESLVVGFAGSNDSFPRPALVIYLNEAPGEAELIEKIGSPSAIAIEGKRAYTLGDWTAYVPGEKEGKILVLGSQEQIKDVMEFDGAPPVLLRQLTRLLEKSNDTHHVTVLGVPNYLVNNVFRDDYEFYFGGPGKVRDAINQIMINDVNAFLFSIALADPVYCELRLNIGSAPNSLALLMKQQEQFHQLADLVEERISSVTIPKYWRRVALRYPQMIRFLDQHIRSAEGDRQLTLNVVMPRQAPQNLLVGAEMLLMAGETTAATVEKTPMPTGPKTMDELLVAKMSLMFDQTPLDFAINDLQSVVRDRFSDLKFPFAIHILGNDLQLAGITQNQQIVGFKEDNKTLGEILTAIVMKANPITTVKSPSELDQKLVWVVGPSPENPAQEAVLITTREAVEKKKFTLPKVFQPEP